jgi:hypothetical protein
MSTLRATNEGDGEEEIILEQFFPSEEHARRRFNVRRAGATP